MNTPQVPALICSLAGAAIIVSFATGSAAAMDCPHAKVGRQSANLPMLIKSIQSPEKKQAFKRTRILHSDTSASYETQIRGKFRQKTRFSLGVFLVKRTSLDDSGQPEITTTVRYEPDLPTISKRISLEPTKYRVKLRIDAGILPVEIVIDETVALLRSERFSVDGCNYDTRVYEFRTIARPIERDRETDLVVRYWYSPQLKSILRTERGHKYKGIVNVGDQVIELGY